MKRQINSSIKAHFIRRAALSLLLVAICIIPFARGQRNAGEKVRAHINRNAVAHAPQISNVYGRAPVVFKRSPIAPFLLNGPLGGTCPSTITQSTSQAIVDGNSVACNNGVGTTENHYWRAFDMNTFTGGQEYDVTSVSFGIELAQSGNGTGQPLTVNLYANNGSPFPGGDWQSNLIATSGELNIPDQADTIFEVPITASCTGRHARVRDGSDDPGWKWCGQPVLHRFQSRPRDRTELSERSRLRHTRSNPDRRLGLSRYAYRD